MELVPASPCTFAGRKIRVVVCPHLQMALPIISTPKNPILQPVPVFSPQIFQPSSQPIPPNNLTAAHAESIATPIPPCAFRHLQVTRRFSLSLDAGGRSPLPHTFSNIFLAFAPVRSPADQHATLGGHGSMQRQPDGDQALRVGSQENPICVEACMVCECEGHHFGGPAQVAGNKYLGKIATMVYKSKSGDLLGNAYNCKLASTPSRPPQASSTIITGHGPRDEAHP
jgi:hypothetical protein